jgi:hypothetical protein
MALRFIEAAYLAGAVFGRRSSAPGVNKGFTRSISKIQQPGHGVVKSGPIHHVEHYPHLFQRGVK